MYYSKDGLKGVLQIDGATVKFDEKNPRSNEFTVSSKSGMTMVMKAPSAEIKAVWVNALEAQVREGEREK